MNEKYTGKLPNQKFASQLPSAFELFKDEEFSKRKPALFLDFDGTLSPIVNDPNGAKLDSQMNAILSQLNKNTSCAVITGRDKADIEQRMAIDDMIYAGSHGYDISGPGLTWIFEEGKVCIPALDEAETALNELLSPFDGAVVERKKFAIAVHYRHVAEEHTNEVLDIVHTVIKKHPCLKAGPGNKVMELKPNIDWHKGKALGWLMDYLNLSLEEYIPIFIGDDLTDEDAFAAIAENGIGIIVGNQSHPTLAAYSLTDPVEVGEFLNQLNETICH